MPQVFRKESEREATAPPGVPWRLVLTRSRHLTSRWARALGAPEEVCGSWLGWLEMGQRSRLPGRLRLWSLMRPYSLQHIFYIKVY